MQFVSKDIPLQIWETAKNLQNYNKQISLDDRENSFPLPENKEK